MNESIYGLSVSQNFVEDMKEYSAYTQQKSSKKDQKTKEIAQGLLQPSEVQRKPFSLKKTAHPSQKVKTEKGPVKEKVSLKTKIKMNKLVKMFKKDKQEDKTSPSKSDTPKVKETKKKHSSKTKETITSYQVSPKYIDTTTKYTLEMVVENFESYFQDLISRKENRTVLYRELEIPLCWTSFTSYIEQSFPKFFDQVYNDKDFTAKLREIFDNIPKDKTKTYRKDKDLYGQDLAFLFLSALEKNLHLNPNFKKIIQQVLQKSEIVPTQTNSVEESLKNSLFTALFLRVFNPSFKHHLNKTEGEYPEIEKELRWFIFSFITNYIGSSNPEIQKTHPDFHAKKDFLFN